MPILIFFLTLVFIFIGFLSNPTSDKTLNPFSAYLMTETHVLVQYYFFSIGIFLAITVIFVRSLQFDKKYSKTKNYFLSLFQILALTITSCFVAYVVLIFIAFVELNIFSLLLQTNPSIVGVITDPNTIGYTLKTFTTPPEIIASDTDPQKEILAIASATTGTDNLFGRVILSTIPHGLILPIHQSNASLLLIDNTLIVTKIKDSDLQAISPIIGYLLVKHYFPTRYIKTYPKIAIMNKSEYLGFRESDINQKISQITHEINKIEANSSSISGSILNAQNKIGENKNTVTQIYTQVSTQYQACAHAGKYISGKFVHTNSPSDCQRVLDQLNNPVKQAGSNINNLNQQLQSVQTQLIQNQQYENSLKSVRVAVQIAKDNFPFELGVFAPNDTIKIAFNPLSAHRIADYLETLTHEYLHYASHVNGQSFDDAFFEEGLTEYFARMTIQDNLNTNTNLGYPVFVKIINQMMKIIPESEFADIYFTKDQARLEAALNRVYGDYFYQNNQLLFETLQYTGNPQQALKLANQIMSQINGTPLKEKDLLSTYSNL